MVALKQRIFVGHLERAGSSTYENRYISSLVYENQVILFTFWHTQQE